MHKTPINWLYLTLALSFLFPWMSAGSALADQSNQGNTVYIPILMSHSLEMVFISAGEFWMGCHAGPCFLGSDFLHAVYLSDYFIDRYEITNAQYAGCVSAGYCAEPAATGSHTRLSYYDDPTYAEYPVFHIAWTDAQDYCQWIGKRLPTEAEWEKAAQGGNLLKEYTYPWGNEAPVCAIGAPNGAHYSDCSPADSLQVGSFRPSILGLYDMAGNVWEWVSDWYDLSYYGNSPYYNPEGPENGTDKVIRGGSWNYMSIGGLRTFDRNFRDPNTALGNHDVGFRCVLIP